MTDARGRLTGTVFVLTAFSIGAPDRARLVGGAVVAVLWAAGLRPDPRRFARLALTALPFLLALPLGLQALTGDGARGLALAARGLCGAACATALAAAVPPGALVRALQDLGAPAVLVGPLAAIERWLGVLAGEARRTLRARELRLEGAPVRLRARTSAALAGALYARARERAARGERALLLRTGGAVPAAPEPGAWPAREQGWAAAGLAALMLSGLLP